MPRDLLAEARMTEEEQNPHAVYAAAANVALGELMERWKSGLSAGGDTRVENVHLHNEDGELIGFRLYLTAREPQVLGGPRVEVVSK